ncbi:hypothetical protein [Klebsiella variicola]|uniref:hypothetical protein n=1 Tax=Klebsiella variicola TaxID=244366 RepID=UPI0034DDF12D
MKRGRPFAMDTYLKVQELKQRGFTQRLAAHEMGMNIRTMQRHWNIDLSAVPQAEGVE